jgi:hypothetical protein
LHQTFIKTAHEADEEVFVTELATLKKLEGLLGHHMTGSQAAKKRFEAMLA